MTNGDDALLIDFRDADDGMAASQSRNARPQGQDNKRSTLLSNEENDLVCQLLGKRCFSMATAVVQLLLTKPPEHSKWNKMATGVACFVKDNPKRSYFIRVFDIDNRKCMIWEQELYTTFKYKTPRTYFHQFEADDKMAGLSFASEQEADAFKTIVREKLNLRQKTVDRKRGSGPTNGHQPLAVQPTTTGSVVKVPPNNRTAPKPNRPVRENNDRSTLRRPRISKHDISGPTNFVHVQHIGWDPVSGFDLDNVAPDLKEFFKVAGVSDQELKDENTRKFIYEFIDKNGGVEQAIKSIKQPPPEPGSHPLTGFHNHGQMLPAAPLAAPPLPTRTHNKTERAPQPPSLASGHNKQLSAASGPPPPPPPPPSHSLNISSPPMSGLGAGAPPPPPPPPPMAGPLTAPIPKPTASQAQSAKAAPVPDMRSALMDQIRGGAKLAHVDAESESVKSNNSSSSGGGGRNALLDQIKGGVVLKRVETNSERPVSGPPVSGLAGALARALEERNRVIQQTDDSSSDSDDGDDEWDD
ncbi:Neural Wiskott-Aldrich syndrome protein [Halotydeus destructor]|nr:Neural Wiskott-Aldrich syndrome protein [Halotydeus destructor]